MCFLKLSQVVHCPFSRSCLANANRTVAVVHCIAVSILVLSSSGPSCFSQYLNQSSHPFNQFSILSLIFPLNLSGLSTQILPFFPPSSFCMSCSRRVFIVCAFSCCRRSSAS